MNEGMVGRQAKAIAAPEERKRITAQVPPHLPSQRRAPANRPTEATAAANSGAARSTPSQ